MATRHGHAGQLVHLFGGLRRVAHELEQEDQGEGAEQAGQRRQRHDQVEPGADRGAGRGRVDDPELALGPDHAVWVRAIR